MKYPILQIIKNYFLKRGWIKVGLGFISLGVSILIPGFWEFIFGTILLNINIETSSQLTNIQIITATVLILSGIMILYLVFINERKKKYLIFEISDKKSWILWNEEKKNSNDPEYTFEIPILIKNGIESVRINKINGTRFIDGSECLMRQPIIYDRQQKINIDFLGDYQTLRTDLLLEPYENRKVIYRRVARAPQIGFNSEHLENGQYAIEFEYQYQNRPKSFSKKLMISQINGQLELIQELNS
ncbi:hypothetical protein [Flavivirga sp. 57AJ16]|uniref:hypothetical protein n=1 Tax=Flavivirga sp. 57AJ16 TaxID=3025307 RepID=UPI002366A28F|nr:hypothetical protein [Flavivirga sp. 57AJ16]MDD7886680.1 hypothetical protein [Flavivirga sp. 57AJ16]